jgi:hypothetical protein
MPGATGRNFIYIDNNFTLKRIPIAGGPPTTVQPMDGPSRGADWGPNDAIVFATGARETGLQEVAAAGGPVTVLTRPDREHGETDHVRPAWLPGGRGILFTILAATVAINAALSWSVGNERDKSGLTALKRKMPVRYLFGMRPVSTRICTKSRPPSEAAADCSWFTRMQLWPTGSSPLAQYDRTGTSQGA